MDDIQKENPNLTFYYSRERRLAKAPEAVRALYNDDAKKSGFIRSLVDTKGKQATFFSIIVLCVLILFLSFFTSAGEKKFMGNVLAATALRVPDANESGVTYIVLTKEAVKGKQPRSGIVDMFVYLDAPAAPNTAASTLWAGSIVFTEAPLEEFRFAVPGNARALALTLSSGDESGEGGERFVLKVKAQ
jgi:hypothetical protein